MSYFECLFCGSKVPISNDTERKYKTSFSGYSPRVINKEKVEFSDFDEIEILFQKCIHCENISVIATSNSKYFGTFSKFIFPSSGAKQFPEYIPKSIKEDYQEAYAIVSLSPKASATLSRRCLQTMIHDFWGIREKNLNAEITKLKEKIPVATFKAINALRSIGNIGAHTEQDVNLIIDVDPDEAKKLLLLIEFLIKEWYVSKHDTEILLSEITAIGEEKQQQRNSSKEQ